MTEQSAEEASAGPSFADSLDMPGYTETSGKLRGLSPENQQGVILGILSLHVNGEEVFHL